MTCAPSPPLSLAQKVEASRLTPAAAGSGGQSLSSGAGGEAQAELAAKCVRLEEEVGELQARLVVVQQQCDRSVAEGKLHAQQSKQAEVGLAVRQGFAVLLCAAVAMLNTLPGMC